MPTSRAKAIIKNLVPPFVWHAVRSWKSSSMPDQLLLPKQDRPLRLNLGCGPNPLPDWLNLDMEASDSRVTQWDLRRALPLSDQSVEVIFTEHFIEHITLQQAEALLCECFRVAKPGARIRISTPDLRYLLDAYLAGRLEEWKEFGWSPKTRADLVNEGMRAWGHQYIHDCESLSALLCKVGFKKPERMEWRQSPSTLLSNLESRSFHGDLIVEAIRE